MFRGERQKNLKTKFRQVAGSKHSRIKTVRETIETIEHKCTSACFRREKRANPKNLQKVNLGYVYVSPDGKCYSRTGIANWMEVLGLTFGWSPEGFTLIWKPAEQLHIHSQGGRTIGKIVDEKEIRPDEKYHFTEAVKKAKRRAESLSKQNALMMPSLRR